MKARYTFCTKRTPSIWLPSCKRCGNCLLCSINKQVLWVVCFAFVFFIISLCTGGSYVQTGQWCVPMVVNWTIKIKRLWKWQKIKLVLMSSAVPLDLRVVDGIDNHVISYILLLSFGDIAVLSKTNCLEFSDSWVTLMQCVNEPMMHNEASPHFVDIINVTHGILLMVVNMVPILS